MVTLFAFLFIATYSFGDETSVRLEAIGMDLVGIVKDEQTDIILNPANLAELKSSLTFFTFNPSRQFLQSASERRRIDEYSYLPSPTVSFGYFVPHTFIPRIGVGVALKGRSYKQYYYNTYGNTKSGYSEYFSQNNNFDENNSFSLLSSFRLTEKMKLGLDYAYMRGNKGSNNENIRHNYSIDIATGDTTDSYSYNDSSGNTNTINGYRVRLGVVTKIGENNDVEMLGEYIDSKSDSLRYSSSLNNQHGTYEYTYNPDTVEYYTKTERYSYDKGENKRTPCLNSKSICLGIKLLHKISADRDICVIGNIGTENSNFSGKYENTSINNDFSYSLHRVTYPDSVVTTENWDTLYHNSSEIDSLSGKPSAIFANFAIGSEVKPNDKTTIGIAVRANYTRDEIEKIIQAHSFSHYDTSAGDTTSLTTTYTTIEKKWISYGYFSIPAGMEYKLNSKIGVLFGITPKFIYEENKPAGFSSLYWQKIDFDYSFGLNYIFSDKLWFNFSNFGDLAYLKNWTLSANYRF